MARYVDNSVTLSAGQAAGTSPVLAAETGHRGNRKAVVLGNPGANAMLVNLATGAAAGTGQPLSAGGIIAFGSDMPGVDGALYVLGTVGDRLTIWVA